MSDEPSCVFESLSSCTCNPEGQRLDATQEPHPKAKTLWRELAVKPQHPATTMHKVPNALCKTQPASTTKRWTTQHLPWVHSQRRASRQTMACPGVPYSSQIQVVWCHTKHLVTNTKNSAAHMDWARYFDGSGVFGEQIPSVQKREEWPQVLLRVCHNGNSSSGRKTTRNYSFWNIGPQKSVRLSAKVQQGKVRADINMSQVFR